MTDYSNLRKEAATKMEELLTGKGDLRHLILCDLIHRMDSALREQSPVLPDDVQEALAAINDAATTGMKKWPNSVIVPIMKLVDIVQRQARDASKAANRADELESPVLPDDVQTMIRCLRDTSNCGIDLAGQAADMLERVLCKNARLEAKVEIDKITMDNFLKRIDELEAREKALIEVLDSIRQKTDILPFTRGSVYTVEEKDDE